MLKAYFFGPLFFLVTFIHAYDWDTIPVPADSENQKEWIIQTNISDDFSYTFVAKNDKSNFGDNKWYNFYHNQWDGPGTTYWKYNHVSVNGNQLEIKTSRWDKSNQSNPQYPYMQGIEEYKMDKANNGVNSGCVTSNNKVQYPVFVEASIRVANIALASCVWLLSPSDKQEIDILENYGGVAYFKQFMHISNHSFIRSPFHDYQPKDKNSWWPDSRVSSTYGWGDYSWNNGNERYVRVGVNWIDPNHFEYFVDGKLIRVMYENAIATDINGTWKYTYYNELHPVNTTDSWGNNVGGLPTNTNGYSDVTEYSTTNEYSFETLKAASDASNGYNVIDPGEYQDGNGFTEELEVIINVESQSWLVSQNNTPNDDDLNNTDKNTMKVDWIRIYKPQDNTTSNLSLKKRFDAQITTNQKTLFFYSQFDTKAYIINSKGIELKRINQGENDISDLSSGSYYVVIKENGFIKASQNIKIN